MSQVRSDERPEKPIGTLDCGEQRFLHDVVGAARVAQLQ